MSIRVRSSTKLLTTLSIVVLIVSIVAIAPPKKALAATSSITVNLYNTSEELVESNTLTLNDLKNLTVYGDDETDRYHQGPTFDEEDLWDEDEDTNLKNKGAVVGADTKDICETLTNTVPTDAEIQIKASDNYSKTFDYDDVYNPEAAQGKLIICYEKDGVEVPSWSDGLQLVFFADDGVFGNYDMHETLDSDEWHYYYSGGVLYPSTNGLSVKYIDEINIYDQ